jgi:ATP-binding cassette subfamily F protein 3
MIRIESLSKSFTETTLLDNLSFHFSEGEKIALVGANGAGKTTLLNIICDLEEADGGKVIKPQNCRIGYLPQKPNPTPRATVLGECMSGASKLTRLQDEMTKALHIMTKEENDEAIRQYEKAESAFRLASGYSLEANAYEILTGLGFQKKSIEQCPLTLSGGWRIRLELAKIFIENPDFLILDEPTNHLDLPSLVWVERYLQNFRGTLLFVSHDRPLLNRLANSIVHLHKGRLTAYKGNFDDFLLFRNQRREEEERRSLELQKKITHMEKFVERFGAKATKAKQAQSRVKMISRLRELEEGLDIEQDDAVVHFSFPKPLRSGRVALSIEDLSIGYNFPLAEKIGFSVERDNRIAVIGSNGIGKSTLLKTIANVIPALKGKMDLGHLVKLAYFAQDHLEGLDQNKTIVETLLSASSEISEKEARSLLGSFLFGGNDALKKIRVLSGGERGRVALASILIKKANLLLLDEPTNHLDMTSVETLISALDGYEGSIMFVSHDREFIDALATHILVMLPDGRSMVFEGKLADYESAAELCGFPNILDLSDFKDSFQSSNDSEKKDKDGDLSLDRIKAKDLKRERNKLEKRVIHLESEDKKIKKVIDNTEAQLLNSDPSDYTKLSELNVELKVNQDKLASCEDEWLSVSSRLEKVEADLKLLGRR